MPRRRTGTCWKHGDHFDVRVTMADGSRSPVIHLTDVHNEATAREQMAVIADAAARGDLVADAPLAAVPKPKGETLADWAGRWFAARARRGLDVYADEKRWAKWVEAFDGLGSTPMVAITTDTIEAFVEHLDGKVLEGALAWKTAINIWGLVTKAFDDATRAKERALRVLTVNVAASVRGPDRGAEKAKAGLWPGEVASLLAEVEAPQHHRRALALLVYLYPRPSELSHLRWSDVDLEHNIVTFHRGRRRRGAQEGTTKTAEPRDVPIEPALLPLLAVMRDEAGGEGLVCKLPDERHLSRWLHTAMARAGVSRAALLESSSTRRRLRAYDLRATGITWRLARGDAPLEVMNEAGHDRFDTTQKYLRAAMLVKGKIGEVFPALPASLLAPGSGSVRVKRQRVPQVAGNMVEAQGIEPWSARRQLQLHSRV